MQSTHFQAIHTRSTTLRLRSGMAQRGLLWDWSILRDMEHHTGTVRNGGGAAEFISLRCLWIGEHVVFVLSKMAGRSCGRRDVKGYRGVL